jgi:hypothetical protein
MFYGNYMDRNDSLQNTISKTWEGKYCRRRLRTEECAQKPMKILNTGLEATELDPTQTQNTAIFTATSTDAKTKLEDKNTKIYKVAAPSKTRFQRRENQSWTSARGEEWKLLRKERDTVILVSDEYDASGQSPRTSQGYHEINRDDA